MPRFVRAGLVAAFCAFVLSSAIAADKPLKQGALDEAAIKLEAQIKSDAGTVTKPPAALTRDADAAFQKNDFRSGMLVLGQLVAVAPDSFELVAARPHHPPDRSGYFRRHSRGRQCDWRGEGARCVRGLF